MSYEKVNTQTLVRTQCKVIETFDHMFVKLSKGDIPMYIRKLFKQFKDFFKLCHGISLYYRYLHQRISRKGEKSSKSNISTYEKIDTNHSEKKYD